MKIRAATINDAPTIAALAGAVWVANYATEGVTTAIAGYVLTEFTEAKIRHDMAETNRRFWLVEEMGCVAFADVILDQKFDTLEASRPAELNRIYVLEAFCGQGVGRKLLDAVKEDVFSLGFDALWLSVWARNQRALKFYEKCGWTRIGTLDFILDGVAHLNYVYCIYKNTETYP